MDFKPRENGMAYTVTVDGLGKHFVASLDWDQDTDDAFRSESYYGLELNVGKGWNSRSNYDLLPKANQLKSIKILDLAAKDISRSEQYHDLEQIAFNCYSDMGPDFQAFPNLEALHLTWRPWCKSLNTLTKLNTLFLLGYKSKEKNLDDLPLNVESLSISQGNVKSLQALSKMEHLKRLELSYLKVGNWAEIECAHKLEELQINSCRTLEEISFVKQIPNLKYVAFIDCGKIETLLPLSELAQIEAVYFFGDTTIVDGDLSFLESMPRLRKVAFGNKKHYNRTLSDIKSCPTFCAPST